MEISDSAKALYERDGERYQASKELNMSTSMGRPKEWQDRAIRN